MWGKEHDEWSVHSHICKLFVHARQEMYDAEGGGVLPISGCLANIWIPDRDDHHECRADHIDSRTGLFFSAVDIPA